MEKRELWLDYLRAFACVLVSLGHLFMSFQDAAIIKNSTLASEFIRIIYHFHVYIFFFCSGYLFQKSLSKCSGRRNRIEKKLVKCLDFMIVYILFSGITYVIKTVLAGDVNSPIEQTFLTVLLKQPINQMWYLYAISAIMLCVPVIASDGGRVVILLAALGMKVFICISTYAQTIPAPFNYLFANAIWFVLGEVWAYKKVVLNKWVTITFAAMFCAMNVIEAVYNVDSEILGALLTFTGVLTSVDIFQSVTKGTNKMPLIWHLLSKYMLQIYLLHTICAAGIRIVLFKLGVTSFSIHFVMGILFSFVVPIICAAFAERTKILNVVFYPIKTVKALKKV